jgi:prepilin-type N-terminal cleavage/methylation domain-containing protein
MIKNLRRKKYLHWQRGFSVLEVLLASIIFVIFSSAAVMVVLQAFNANRIGQENSIATQFATEGLEAVRSIRNQGFTNIDGLASTYCSSGAGVQLSGGVWTLKAAATSDTLSSDTRFSRVITICDAIRTATASSDLDTSGITYENVKKVTSTVTWKFKSAQSTANSISLVTYLTNWRSKKGGMLVYGDGGTTANTIKYRVYDASTDTWGTPTNTQVSLGSNSSYAVRNIRVYSSATRNEKIAVARLYNSSTTSQQIWGMVYDGDAGTWGHAQQLSSWNATTFLDVRNFGGTYLKDGEFVIVYSNNSTTPQSAVWNGASWTTGIALSASTDIPNFIIASARPSTNEIMAAFYGQGSDTNTEYYDGTTPYAAGHWSTRTSQATNAPSNAKEMMDFSWIPNDSIKGTLMFSQKSTDKAMTSIEFTADGAGSGTWSTTKNAGTQGVLGAMNIDGRNYVSDALSCNKDANNDIYCFKADLSGSAPSWSTPTNNIMTTNTDTGNERSFDVAYTATSGAQAIVVYSDNTAVPKYKKYDPVANSFDVNPTTITTLSGSVIVTGIRALAQPEGDDIMFLIFDNSRRVTTVAWNRLANAMYSSGGKLPTSQGINGSVAGEFWANFAWDKF